MQPTNSTGTLASQSSTLSSIVAQNMMLGLVVVSVLVLCLIVGVLGRYWYNNKKDKDNRDAYERWEARQQAVGAGRVEFSHDETFRDTFVELNPMHALSGGDAASTDASVGEGSKQIKKKEEEERVGSGWWHSLLLFGSSAPKDRPMTDDEYMAHVEGLTVELRNNDQPFMVQNPLLRRGSGNFSSADSISDTPYVVPVTPGRRNSATIGARTGDANPLRRGSRSIASPVARRLPASAEQQQQDTGRRVDISTVASPRVVQRFVVSEDSESSTDDASNSDAAATVSSPSIRRLPSNMPPVSSARSPVRGPGALSDQSSLPSPPHVKRTPSAAASLMLDDTSSGDDVSHRRHLLSRGQQLQPSSPPAPPTTQQMSLKSMQLRRRTLQTADAMLIQQEFSDPVSGFAFVNSPMAAEQPEAMPSSSSSSARRLAARPSDLDTFKL